MPYSIANPPEKIKDMPAHAREIWIAAFNSALAQYKDEGKANATAYAAVKTKYKQDDKGNWVAKEAAPPAENVIAKGVDVVEISCPKCGGDRFEPEGDHLRCIKCKTLVEKEKSMEAKFARMIQEQATRKADPDRIRKVTELYQSEASDEEKVKALDEVLDWLKVQEVMKTEDGVQYPAAAFAYTPEKSSGWKLRLWEIDKVTRKQLGAAAAALSPGGFRGQRVDIPREDLPTVKRKIREQYRKLDVPDEEIPRWVQESTRRDLLYNYTPLNEADIGSKGIAKVIVIKPGFGNPVDNHYYPAETLSRDYSVFEGVKMYSDHQTEEEEKQRPEGSIRQWVASLKNVRFEEGIGIVGDAVIVEPWLQQKLATLRDQKLLSEMGISIRAAGVGTKGKIDGKETNIVERITRVRSVDFVTEAGAGGGVLLYETERELDIDIIGLDILKERRPDLVKSIEKEVKEMTIKEVKKMEELEKKVEGLTKQVETLTTERDEARTKLSEAEKAQRKAEAKSKIDEAISKADLPDAAKARLVEKFKDAESADIGDAIKAETDYVNALKEASKPKNLGDTKPDPDKSRKDLVESFKKLHPEWTKEQVETAVNAR
jgi:cation transport regulator